MKYLILCIVVLVLLILLSCSTTYDPSKPVYQGKVFKTKVDLPKDIDWKELHQIEMSRNGTKLMWYGAIMLAVGIAASCSLRNKLAETIGSFVGFLGMGFMCIGLLQLKVVENWHWVGIGVLGIAIIGAVVYFRDRGFKLSSKKGLIKEVKKRRK